MTGPFDLIFLDLEFSAYRPIIEQILNRGLLAEDGIILVDNGMSMTNSLIGNDAYTYGSCSVRTRLRGRRESCKH